MFTVIPPPFRFGAAGLGFASAGGLTTFITGPHVAPPSGLRRASTSMSPQSALPFFLASQYARTVSAWRVRTRHEPRDAVRRVPVLAGDEEVRLLDLRRADATATQQDQHNDNSAVVHRVLGGNDTPPNETLPRHRRILRPRERAPVDAAAGRAVLPRAAPAAPSRSPSRARGRHRPARRCRLRRRGTGWWGWTTRQTCSLSPRRKRDAVGLRRARSSTSSADILKLDLGRRFDWVCIFFNTFLGFPTLEQQDRLLQIVRRHLKPAGRLWLDVFQPDLERLARPSVKSLEPTVFYVPRYDRTVVKTTDIRQSPRTRSSSG